MSRHKVQKSSFGNNAAPKKSSSLNQASSWTNPYQQRNAKASEQPINTVKPPTTAEWLQDNIFLKAIETRKAQLQRQQLEENAGTEPQIESIQTKLTVGEPGDKYEQEADMMASRVMSMPDNAVQRASVEVQTKPANAFTPIVQRAARPEMGRTSQAHGNIESRLNSSKGGGRPLPLDVRGFMEPRFGADFSSVRVHTGSEAVQMSRELGAQAFTHGSDVYYGEGKAPGNNDLTAHELTHVVQQTGTIQRQNTPLQLARSNSKPKNSYNINNKVAFVREEGLNLRQKPDQKSASLAQLKFGQRVYILEDSAPQSGWQKVAVLGKTGYAFAPRIHQPPDKLIQQDPALSLIKVQSGENFWDLVKKMYGIKGNESTPDQNINHFINAIRAFNKPEAFKVKTGSFSNSVIPGRDASNTELIGGVDLWIPSFGVAAKMDVGSGTVTGEVSRNLKKIDQKLQDFKLACQLSGQFIPGAIARHAANASKGLLEGLIKFAKEAAIILATSTTVGALIGSMFGGVGAIPGAEIGFEIGLLILEIYGLKMLVEAVFGIAGNLLSQLGQFIKLVWTANGDRKKLEEAAKSLAEALGSLVDAILLALVAYLAKKGADAFSKTKFAQTVGETPLMQWLKERQQLKTSRQTLKDTLEIGAKRQALRKSTLDESQVNKHLPNTAESNKLIRKEGSAHVFKDRATMDRVTQEIINRGDYLGTVRGHDRWGLSFDKPIGERIAKDGSKIPLTFGELKLKGGKYHAVPRTKSAK
ncbi:SH3 domain-containing protein [Cylindrospermum stagnale PCC 7417]|uniref:SH3 domain-containing protein n=1 Tax=Cylindrospermum stagnale PCC 7417 TaxID=56107 RepID=K9X3K5_9NOST|nr:DUF4157 domain-containing protein [Cylindrospermum stagnale]AFZ26626.1 SH3 domain-containing protein [Cylindrospermum stagnale PCC 7417]